MVEFSSFGGGAADLIVRVIHSHSCQSPLFGGMDNSSMDQHQSIIFCRDLHSMMLTRPSGYLYPHVPRPSQRSFHPGGMLLLIVINAAEELVAGDDFTVTCTSHPNQQVEQTATSATSLSILDCIRLLVGCRWRMLTCDVRAQSTRLVPRRAELHDRKPVEYILAVSYHDDASLVRERDAVFDVPPATVRFRAGWLSEADDEFGGVHIFPVIEREAGSERAGFRAVSTVVALDELFTALADGCAIVRELVFAIQPSGLDGVAECLEFSSVGREFFAAAVSCC